MVANSLISQTKTQDTSWQWHSWEGMPYLTCSLLNDWQHGFFTQQFSPRTPEELVNVFTSDSEVYRLKQIHGNLVLTPTEITALKTQLPEEENLASGDAIITESSQQAVWVASADCTPLLIGDLKTGKVAAIHAGWRGTAQKIVCETIARFLASGSIKENLRIVMGPAINGEVYQVTEQVAIEVGKSIIGQEVTDVLTALQQLPNSPVLADDTQGRVRLDVRRVNAIQLEKLDIQPEQIAIAPHCTYQQPDYFFSYRRSQQKKVQWSGIISN